MNCPKCQTNNPENKKFCRECGAELLLVCPNCGTALGPEDKFCGDCGHNLASEAVTHKTEATPDAERKQVTALFSDLSGYTAMTERLDPEEVKEITGRIFDGVRAVVGKYDGFIERFAGDGVLALFGVPKSHEDDPIRAIRAAREIHELVEGMNPVYEAKVGAPLSMHSGINTGLAVTADVDPEKGTHGVTGDAINIAARLSDLAKASEILIGPSTCRQAEGHFALEALEPTKFKGKSEPISVYRVLSLKEEPITVHRQSGLRATLIGRRAELAQLCEAAERLKGGSSSVISISGDAGTGKSRLVEEFKASLDLSKIRWREGHSYPYAQNIPYFPLMDLISRAWRIEEGDPPERIMEKIESGVERLLGTRENVAPYVGSLYSLRYPEIEEVSPEFWKSRLFESIKAIVVALTQHAPTIFCFEDIHWADPSTLELLRFLVSDPKYTALFVCVHRLPFSLFSAHQLNALPNLYEEIRLQDLSPSDTLDMVESLLKADNIPGELRKFIQNKVEGNPFYIEEVMNSLIESGTLSSDNGAWRLTRTLQEAEIPPTVQGVISARLDRLDRETKRILQEASVIGRAFLYEILKKVTETHEPIDRFLSGLERLDLIRARSLEPELEYIFKHALTQEVVYNGLLKKERQEIHERIGLVMEHLFQDRLTEFYETLAFHFKQGLSLRRAVDYLMKSGEKSLSRYAVEESHRYYQEAYELLVNKRDMTREEEELLIDLLIGWAYVFYFRGDWRRMGDLLRLYLPLAESLGDYSRLGMFYAWIGFSHFAVDTYGEGYDFLSRALSIGKEIDDPKVTGYASAWLSWTCDELGLLDEAILHGETAQKISKSLPSDHYLYFKSLGGMALARFYKGETSKCLADGKALVEYANQHDNLRSLGMGHHFVELSHITRGDLAAAVEYGQKAVDVPSEPLYHMAFRVGLGLSQVLRGNFHQADEILRPVSAFCQEFQVDWLERMAQVPLGAICIAKGRMSEGFGILEQTRQQCFESGRKYWYATSEYILGRIYLQIVLGEEQMSMVTLFRNVGFLIKAVPFAASKAEGHFNKAIGVAEEIGAKGILGQVYLDLGRLHKAKKRKDKARECIAKAIEYFEICEAETFLKQAREELQSLG
jgi:class 3 adenylate cyclase/tetratricopeptide (TPR) repeat protein